MAWQRGRSYSQDLRERVLAADELSARQAAQRFAVSVSHVIKARQRRDRTGVLTIKQRGYRKPQRIAGNMASHVIMPCKGTRRRRSLGVWDGWFLKLISATWSAIGAATSALPTNGASTVAPGRS